MDVNQTRFHLLLGETDWLGGANSPPNSADVQWNPVSTTVELMQRLFVFPKRKAESPPSLDQRRGAAMDHFSNWYFLAESRREVRFVGAGQTVSQHFWSPDDEKASPPAGDFTPVATAHSPVKTMSGLAVSAGHYLVVGLSEPKGLLIFDLFAGGAPQRLIWPETVDFAPFDLSATPDGAILVLDREHHALWQLDRNFSVCGARAVLHEEQQRQDFQPISGPVQMKSSPPPARRITAEMALPLPIDDLRALAALPEGDVLLLGYDSARACSVVHRLRNGTPSGTVALDGAVMTYTEPDACSLEGYDMAFCGGTLYVLGSDGNQAFAFTYKEGSGGFSLALQPRYFPVREFTGKALVTGGDAVFYDFGDRWMPLAEQPRPRYEVSGTLRLPALTPAFDGRLPGCVWHRLVLDACIPPGAAVHVESRATDSQAALETAPWQHEPEPYLRDVGASGSITATALGRTELSGYRSPLNGPAERVGAFELLFQGAVGRYLQLRLTLKGTGRNTPRLQAMRVWYPRFSYLEHYLPAVYREDVTSASFLDRYLANVEGLFTTLEGRIEQAQELFDSRTVPPEYMEWLASWLGAQLDTAWTDSTRRLFLKHARELFVSRGTPTGILWALHLSLDEQPDESIFETCSCGCSAPASQTAQTFPVRLREEFLTRTQPGVLFQPGMNSTQPGTAPSDTWTPAKGPAHLDALFRTYLERSYPNIDALNSAWGTKYAGFDDQNLRLPAVEPASAACAIDWTRFLTTLDFTYAPPRATDREAYRDFLVARYRQAADLNRAYGFTGGAALASFDEVGPRLWDTQLAAALPPSGRWFQDWILFVALALPMRRQAHRFTVLVPVSTDSDIQTQLRRADLARRIAEVQKPAHTQVDVQLYWAMFRVGAARLGSDSSLGKGSRFMALQLDASYLGSSYLGFVGSWSAQERTVIGRDRIERLPTSFNSSRSRPI